MQLISSTLVFLTSNTFHMFYFCCWLRLVCLLSSKALLLVSFFTDVFNGACCAMIELTVVMKDSTSPLFTSGTASQFVLTSSFSKLTLWSLDNIFYYLLDFYYLNFAIDENERSDQRLLLRYSLIYCHYLSRVSVISMTSKSMLILLNRVRSQSKLYEREDVHMKKIGILMVIWVKCFLEVIYFKVLRRVL